MDFYLVASSVDQTFYFRLDQLEGSSTSTISTLTNGVEVPRY